MAAPVTDDWGAVRDSAVSLQSISEAARKHGVSIDAACQRARREKWPVGRRPAKALAAAKEAHAQAIITANPNAVRNVRTTADVVSDRLAEDSKETRLSLSRAARRMAKEAETAPLEQAGDALQAGKLAAQVHNWDGDREDRVTLQFFSIAMNQADQEPERPAIDV